MPTHSDYLAVYRYGGYQPQVHMSVYVPQILWSGELTATPDNPTKTIEVDYDVDPTFTGAVPPPGYYCAQIIFRDPVTGKRKGVGRVADTRAAYSPNDDTTHINIREFGLGQGALEDGDTFEIVAFYPMDTKLVADTTTGAFDQLFCPDGRIHYHEGDDPSPIANSGGHWAGWLYPGQSWAYIPGYGTRSFITDPDGAGSYPMVHTWTPLTSGVTNTGLSSAADTNFQTTVGSHCVNHLVEQSDNGYWEGKGSYSNQYHIVHDSDNPPHEVILTNYAGDTETGINWTAEVLSGDVDTETIPDGAFVILWVDDYFGQPIGGNNPAIVGRFNETFLSYRSHMIGQGYVRRLTESMDGGSGVQRLTLEIQSPLSKLAEITSYSHYMIEGSGTFEEWQVIKTLGVKRAILELWEYYTTGMEAGIDFLVNSTFSDTRYPQFYIQRSDTVTQMRELAYSRNGVIHAVERNAAIELKCHPALVELGDRP